MAGIKDECGNQRGSAGPVRGPEATGGSARFAVSSDRVDVSVGGGQLHGPKSQISVDRHRPSRHFARPSRPAGRWGSSHSDCTVAFGQWRDRVRFALAGISPARNQIPHSHGLGVIESRSSCYTSPLSGKSTIRPGWPCHVSRPGGANEAIFRFSTPCARSTTDAVGASSGQSIGLVAGDHRPAGIGAGSGAVRRFPAQVMRRPLGKSEENRPVVGPRGSFIFSYCAQAHRNTSSASSSVPNQLTTNSRSTVPSPR